MSLRDEISAIVDGEMAVSCRCEGGRIVVEADYWTPATDRILALIRDRLLSDEAVEASALEMLAVDGFTDWNMTDAMKESAVQGAPCVITAALDAALGKDGE